MPKVSRPLGARVIVKEIETTLSLEARGKKLNITVITNDNNRPKSTQGTVIALGTDPFLRENGLTEGCVVTFAPLSGVRIFIEGVEYRSLELQEIIMVTTEVPNEASVVDTNSSSNNDVNVRAGQAGSSYAGQSTVDLSCLDRAGVNKVAAPKLPDADDTVGVDVTTEQARGVARSTGGFRLNN